MNIPKLRFKDNNGNDYPQWEKVNLSDICSFLQGLTYTPNDVSNTGILVLRSSNIQNDKISYLDNVFVNINIPDNLFVKENDILMCVRNGSKSLVGKNALITPKDLGNTWGAFMMIVRNKLSNKYVYYYLNTNIFNKHIFKDLGTATINQITKKMLQSFKIYLPQITEQEKISNFLTTVDKKITNLENTITSLENQKKGLLQQIFSQKLRFKDENGNNYPNWEKKKLGDIGSFSRGGNLSKSDLSKKGTSCILYGELYTYYNEFATEIKSKTLNTTNLVLSKKYDVLLPLSGETAEDISTCTCIFFDDIALGSDLLIFRSSFFDGRFMSLLLKYKYKYKIAQIAQGKSIVHISEKNIKNINIKIPCIEEQQKIADFILIFTKKLENQKAQLEHWQQIKKGLLQQMFV